MFEFDDENKEHPIGSMLRYYREQRGKDLDSVAEQLRIRRDYLAAMEQDRFDLLPEGMYRRSFLRAYASYLKLDPDHIMKMFDEQHRIEEEDQVEARATWIKAHLGEAQEQPTPPQEKFSAQKVASFLRFPFKLSTSGLLFLIAIVIVLLVIFFFLLFRPVIENRSDTGMGSAAQESLRVISEPVDTMKLFMQMVDDSITQAPEWTLRINSIGECWMNLDSDGKRLFSAMVFENINLEFKAKDSFTIYSGKNQGLRLWLNGFELKLLPNGVTNLNRQNFKDYISTDVANRKVRRHE
jgi:transcriptional regulator with XRE-family HTH domain